MREILVTGAAGFIGLHLAEHLVRDSNNKLILLDNFARGINDSRFSELGNLPNVEIISEDIQVAARHLPDVDYIYHLASINGTSNFYSRPFDVLEAAIEPSLALLRRYRDSKRLKRFLLASTSEVYAGAVELGLSSIPTAESTPLVISDAQNPRWSYAGGKIAAELATLAAAKQFGMLVSIVRYHNVYGPRMGKEHVIPQLILRFRNGDFRLFGSTNTRSFIYIDDAVQATVVVAKSIESIGRTVHIGTGDEITIKELADVIMETLDCHGELVAESAPDGSVSRRCPDTSFLNENLDFYARIGLRQGVLETAKFYSD